jgi:hypothetical protein
MVNIRRSTGSRAARQPGLDRCCRYGEPWRRVSEPVRPRSRPPLSRRRSADLWRRHHGPEPQPHTQYGGFVKSYFNQQHNISHSQKIKNYFTPGKLPVLTGLAAAFAVFNLWFASIPGPTLCNRACAHYGTSFGQVRWTSFTGISSTRASISAQLPRVIPQDCITSMKQVPRSKSSICSRTNRRSSGRFPTSSMRAAETSSPTAASLSQTTRTTTHLTAPAS